jgi:protein-S-isoprenylcysteine O-methyltransferase Ste14
MIEMIAAWSIHHIAGPADALLNLVFATLLLFVPFDRWRDRGTSGAYLLFVLASSFLAAPASDVPTRHLVFLLLAMAGSALILAGWARIYRDVRPDDAPGGEPAPELMEDGIYRMLRHPQYLGFLLVTLGILVERPSLPTAVLWALLVLLYQRLARVEERELARRYGARWRAYRRRTGMFFPRR